ncbi:phosphoribosylanthranilate isomerase [Leeia aquatica]|uniref:N-(5'-phosphoribosyl)anthranilate isomerase n=1 Tax=Leeia aquatica TaxID=2725557 RepID=A0A847RVX7_9NEIS|nr:phosphoribosylanthranilate isomerase [Leeia aquatica]NLR73971.1 phosphoribosylanthranilate isomerase [Leeia aquatica]
MRTRVKICGLSRPEDVAAAAQAGADAIGLVFYPPSPRGVSIAQAAGLLRHVPAFVSTVGLFVDPTEAEVRQVLAQCPLDVLQFHGDESPSFCRSFGRPYLKAVRVKPGLDLLQYAENYADAAGLLLDAWVAGVPGGTGQSFDWSLIPADLPLPLILAGGLDPDNVAEAIGRVKPWAVDVSGGVEREKGVKDPARIEAFMRAVATTYVG